MVVSFSSLSGHLSQIGLRDVVVKGVMGTACKWMKVWGVDAVPLQLGVRLAGLSCKWMTFWGVDAGKSSRARRSLNSGCGG